MRAERTERMGAFSSLFIIATILLGACSSSSSGPGTGAGGNIGTGGAIASGAGGGTGAGGDTGAGGTIDSGAGGSGGSDGSVSCHAPGALQVTNSGRTAYVIDGASNPSLTFCRGSTYVFAVNATGHPFYIKTVQSAGTGNAYSSGVDGNGTEVGNVTFAVPADAPDTLFYDCSLHVAMTGTIQIVN